MIRCPTCGMEWSPGTLTCPKDGTRLFEPVATATLGLDDDGSDHTVRAEPGMVPLGMLDTLPATASEQTPQVRPRASGNRRAAELPPEARSGPRRSLEQPPEPRAVSRRMSGVPADAPPEPGSRPRPLVSLRQAPVQPLPSPQGEKNPWGDEGSGTDPTAPSRGLIGVQLGEYRVLELLGQGGMGVVYRGEQPVIGKQVAIKLLRPELASDPKQMKRLLDEARAVNAVRHPGLVDIFSFGQTPDGAQYFVMELLEGQSLEERLHARGKLKAWEAVPILEQALSALDAAHGAGVIHRDLKPSNIFLVDLPDHTNLVKLLDFGLAKIGAGPRGSTPQTTNVVVGTPEYMAPEQARAQEVSPRTDIYAVGIVAYELLTGDVPFSSESAVETLMMQLDKPPTPPGEREPTIPEALEDLILRMIAKRPEERPASAAEVKRELGRIKRQLTQAETVVAEKPLRSAFDTLPLTPSPGAGPTPVETARAEEATETKPSMRAVPVPQGSRFESTDVMPPVQVKDTPPSRRPLEPRPATDRLMKPGPSRAWLLPMIAAAALVALLAVWFFLFVLRDAGEVNGVLPPPPPPVVHAPLAPSEPPAPPEAPPRPVEHVEAPPAPSPPKPPPPPRPRPVPQHSRQEVLNKLSEYSAKSDSAQNPRLARLSCDSLRDQVEKNKLTPEEAWNELETRVRPMFK